MKLSLVYPAWCGGFGAYSGAARRVSTFPPLNLCIIAALAEREGWEVQIIDAHIEGLDEKAIVRRVREFGPALAGFTSTTPFFGAAASCARALGVACGIPVMIGGTHASLLREDAFLDCFDYLFFGECEMTFPAFLRAFAAGERRPLVPGVMMRDGRDVICRGDAPRLDDLDQAPLPARHLLPLARYVLGTRRGRKRYTSVQMTRGCPFSCVFCACDLYGRTLRKRSVEHVLDELETLTGRMGIEHIFFVDDTLTISRKFILDLCEGIEARRLHFTFEGSTRADLWDEEMVDRLRSAGLVRITFGLESADPEVRKIIRKDIPLEAYANANRLSNRLGIETINSAVIGLPGDTRESIERTVDHLARSRHVQHVTLNTAVPYPGTEMRRMAETGRHGLRLVQRDYSRLQRYGSAAMEVNGISPSELVQIQRYALLRIYRRWWRIIPVLRRFGLYILLVTGTRVLLEMAWGMIHGAAGKEDA